MPRRYSICGEAEYRRSREQNKFICIAEALQDMRRSRISQKPRAEQIYLHCRGATGYAAKPNIAEAGTKSDTGAVAQPNAAMPTSHRTDGLQPDCKVTVRQYERNAVARLLSYFRIRKQCQPCTSGSNTINTVKMKRSFKIEVDCANCANLIEDAVKKIKGVEEVTVSFMTQKMKIGFEAGSDPESVLEEVRRTARKIEPDFSII